MNDTLILISEHLLSQPSDPSALLAFVKLQATNRAVWQHYRQNTELWRRLGSQLPQWSLPEHMGLRRRVIMGIKLLHTKCIACGGKASRVFMAFQSRICGKCCHRVLISDFELAWLHGIDRPSPSPYIARYIGDTRVRFFLRQHVMMRKSIVAYLSWQQAHSYARRWPGITRVEIKRLVDRMA